MTERLAANCSGFRWIGQSFRSCDACGAPYWEHTHEHHPTGPPFGDNFELRPISAEDAAIVQARWDPDHADYVIVPSSTWVRLPNGSRVWHCSGRSEQIPTSIRVEGYAP